MMRDYEDEYAERNQAMPAPAPVVEPAPTPAPAPYQAKGPILGLEGFDADKLANGHISPKYVLAKHAKDLGWADRDELLRRLQADESGYFKNARWQGDNLYVDGDLDPKFGGLRHFDVQRGAKAGGLGWQWLPIEAQAQMPMRDLANPVVPVNSTAPGAPMPRIPMADIPRTNTGVNGPPRMDMPQFDMLPMSDLARQRASRLGEMI